MPTGSPSWETAPGARPSPCSWPRTPTIASASGAPARRTAGILRERRENVRLLPGVPIPPSVHLTTDAAEATAGADLWVAAIPTVYLRATLQRIAPPGPRTTAGPQPGQGHGESTRSCRPTEIMPEVLGADAGWPC